MCESETAQQNHLPRRREALRMQQAAVPRARHYPPARTANPGKTLLINPESFLLITAVDDEPDAKGGDVNMEQLSCPLALTFVSHRISCLV